MKTKHNDFDFLYDELMKGTAFGRVSTDTRFPVFRAAIQRGRTIQTHRLFCWQHYGSSANNATKKDLRWLLKNIFELSATEFLQRYYPKCYCAAELPRRDRFALYKRIKAQLLESGEYSFDSITSAMRGDLLDIDFGYTWD